ncbi:MAG TPA: element excision factor XisH family protein [Chthonomonadaceae bacterium]|nr:element excision factor XisH family protein [Chthonomonadaceae bacterium]
MARRDLFHDACKNALIKDGWTITHDPYLLRRGRQTQEEVEQWIE